MSPRRPEAFVSGRCETVCQRVGMTWEWVAPISTVVVALAGLGATMRTASRAREHAEQLADKRYRQEREEQIRRGRLELYTRAMEHAVDQERQLETEWAFDGAQQFRLTPSPAGEPLSLASMDGITARMRLLADEDVEEAWARFAGAWSSFRFWADNLAGGPDHKAPEDVVRPLQEAIVGLKFACRLSLGLDGDRG